MIAAILGGLLGVGKFMLGLAQTVLTFLLTTRVGQIILLVIVALILAWLWHGAGVREGRVEGRAEIQATIDKPVTGWAARLAQCRANTKTLSDGLARQNAALKARSDADAARLIAASKAVAEANKATSRAEARAKAVLRPLTGKTQCDRLLEVDARTMEALK